MHNNLKSMEVWIISTKWGLKEKWGICVQDVLLGGKYRYPIKKQIIEWIF